MKGYTIYNTKMGYFKIEYEDGYITFLQKVDIKDIHDLGNKTELTEKVYIQLEEYFVGKRKYFDIPCNPKGTKFQLNTWKALCDIPYGQTRTYKQIACAIGNEKASRAIGNANNKNPIHIIIPCHRVIGTSGKLVGYAGGLDMKEYLLNMEKTTEERI